MRTILVVTLLAGCAAEANYGQLRVRKKTPPCTLVTSEWVHARPGQDLSDAIVARAKELGSTDIKLVGDPTSELGGEAGGGAIAPRSAAGTLASTSTRESWSQQVTFFHCSAAELELER